MLNQRPLRLSYMLGIPNSIEVIPEVPDAVCLPDELADDPDAEHPRD
jgi:hypothetical protein